MDWSEKITEVLLKALGSEKLRSLMIKYLVCVLVFYAIGAYSWPKVYYKILDPDDIVKMANERNNPPTNRNEDFLR